MTDAEIEKRVGELRAAVLAWAERHQLWNDAWLKTFAEHFNDRPWRLPCVLVLAFDGWALTNALNGDAENSGRLLDELRELVSGLGFHWEMQDSNTAVFTPDDDRREEWYDYYHFRWLCEFVRPGYVDVSSELFTQFQRRPEDLHRLEPRGFEVLIDSVLRNNGFRTELGPGQGDGGVDVRLYRSDLVGELLTLVQVKRYAPDRPIGLEAVAALDAIVRDEQANSGLFVTTSRFLPVAKSFASRKGRTLQLADRDEVVRWCEAAANAIAKRSDRAWVERVHALAAQGVHADDDIGRVVHATWGVNMQINDFRLIVRATEHAVLLSPLTARIVDHDGYAQTGNEVPDFTVVPNHTAELVVARRNLGKRGGLYFWGDQRLFKFWDGKPKYFNYMD